MEHEKRVKQEKTFWNKHSYAYDNFIFKHWKIYNSVLFDKIKQEVKGSAFVLDLACGTGLISEQISAKAEKVVAIDMSENMIEQANIKKKEQGIKNIEYLVEDAYSLSFENDMFDTVVCINALHNMQNPKKALSEINRVLKPDGKLIVSIVGVGTSLKFKIIFSLMSIFKKTPLPIFHKVNLKQATAIVKQAGFKIISNKEIKDENDMMPLLYIVAQN